ncbi:hypothetical protein SDC9_145453 [bioreactor metagenome]|uniref:Uncharacterized protein n=1 Tax=bioreactor metagenome TaxID=1076179 RepID=A0A645EAU8_9ZZZZ
MFRQTAVQNIGGEGSRGDAFLEFGKAIFFRFLLLGGLGGSFTLHTVDELGHELVFFRGQGTAIRFAGEQFFHAGNVFALGSQKGCESVVCLEFVEGITGSFRQALDINTPTG